MFIIFLAMYTLLFNNYLFILNDHTNYTFITQVIKQTITITRALRREPTLSFKYTIEPTFRVPTNYSHRHVYLPNYAISRISPKMMSIVQRKHFYALSNKRSLLYILRVYHTYHYHTHYFYLSGDNKIIFFRFMNQP